VIVFSLPVSLTGWYVVQMIIGMRVDLQDEIMGLDM
jgi:hypothetical protein